LSWVVSCRLDGWMDWFILWEPMMQPYRRLQYCSLRYLLVRQQANVQFVRKEDWRHAYLLLISLLWFSPQHVRVVGSCQCLIYPSLPFKYLTVRFSHTWMVVFVLFSSPSLDDFWRFLWHIPCSGCFHSCFYDSMDIHSFAELDDSIIAIWFAGWCQCVEVCQLFSIQFHRSRWMPLVYYFIISCIILLWLGRYL
jgi:hypothetical protein